MGTAPVGGAFPVVGGALAEVLNENRGENGWRVQAKGTKGSQENIRRLGSGDLQLALSNSAISYFSVRGEAGWEKPYDIRAIATLAPNVAMFITKTDSGIKTLTDLKGKRAMVGVAGAGFEMFVQPLLAAHGVTYDDFTQVYGTQSGAVDMLGDGSVDAAFLGGAVPTGSITQAASTYDIHFVPFVEETRQQLVGEYPFFQPVTVTADKYSDLEEDFQGLNVGSMHLITSADQGRRAGVPDHQDDLGETVRPSLRSTLPVARSTSRTSRATPAPSFTREPSASTPRSVSGSRGRQRAVIAAMVERLATKPTAKRPVRIHRKRGRGRGRGPVRACSQVAGDVVEHPALLLHPI